MVRRSAGVLEVLQKPLLHYSIYSIASSGHCQEFLPNAQLHKLRKEDLGDKNFVGGKLAGRDCFVVYRFARTG